MKLTMESTTFDGRSGIATYHVAVEGDGVNGHVVIKGEKRDAWVEQVRDHKLVLELFGKRYEAGQTALGAICDGALAVKGDTVELTEERVRSLEAGYFMFPIE